MREHIRIVIALVAMIGFALLLALTRGVELETHVRRLLVDIPLVAGIVICLVYLLLQARKALHKAG